MGDMIESISNRGEFVSDVRRADPFIESYRPADMRLFESTRDMMLRGSLREALWVHEQQWANARMSPMSEAIGVNDLPVLLAATIRTRFIEGYGAVTQPWTSVVRTEQLSDLEVWSAYGLNVITDDTRGNATPNNLLPEVKEYGMYNEAQLSEFTENAQLKTYGITWSITRRMMLADNIRLMTRMATDIGIAMKRTETWNFINTLELGATTSVSGAVMNDGYHFFDTTYHGNLHTGSIGLSADNVKAEMLLYGAQVDRNGISNNRNGIKPKFLCIPAALEQIAWDIVSPAARITGASTTTTSDNYLSFLVPVVIPELTSDVDWYLSADPGMYPGISHGTLAGASGPEYFTQLENTDLSQADGTKQKIRYDFGFWGEEWHTWRKVDVSG